jgi:hypothetical protein
MKLYLIMWHYCFVSETVNFREIDLYLIDKTKEKKVIIGQ